VQVVLGVVEHECPVQALAAQRRIRSFSDLHDWAQWHKIKVRSRIKAASPLDVLATGSGIQMQSSISGAPFTDQGHGALILAKENLTFTTAKDRQCRVFSVAEIEDCVVQRADVFEIRHGPTYHRFRPSRTQPHEMAVLLPVTCGDTTGMKKGDICEGTQLRNIPLLKLQKRHCLPGHYTLSQPIMIGKTPRKAASTNSLNYNIDCPKTFLAFLR